MLIYNTKASFLLSNILWPEANTQPRESAYPKSTASHKNFLNTRDMILEHEAPNRAQVLVKHITVTKI